jgi:hypothetical protein
MAVTVAVRRVRNSGQIVGSNGRASPDAKPATGWCAVATSKRVTSIRSRAGSARVRCGRRTGPINPRGPSTTRS